MTEYKDWHHQLIALMNTNTISRRQAADMVGVARSTALDYLRKYYKEIGDEVQEEQAVETGVVDNSRILVISDLHLPYGHPHAFEFLRALKEKYKPTRVISVGDELDYSAASYHEASPDLYSAGHELEKAIKQVKELEKMFPQMDIMDSNHGSMMWRKAKTHGIPSHCIKSYNDVLGVGEGWKWHNDLIVRLPNGQSVYFCHGRSTDGLKLSKNMGCNAVQGHYHSKFNIQYWSNPENLFWSMQVGCLIDDKSLAMAYNKLTLDRPIIGCGLIIDGKPILEEMKL